MKFMIRPARSGAQALVLLFMLLQGAAPLLHAHPGGDGALEGALHRHVDTSDSSSNGFRAADLPVLESAKGIRADGLLLLAGDEPSPSDGHDGFGAGRTPVLADPGRPESPSAPAASSICRHRHPAAACGCRAPPASS
jgi:hypothetical protein